MLQFLSPEKKQASQTPQDAGVQPTQVNPLHQDIPKQAQAMKFRYGNGDQPLSGFTIKRGVGIGGFGEVYFATNEAGKEVAIKQVQRNLDVEVRGAGFLHIATGAKQHLVGAMVAASNLQLAQGRGIVATRLYLAKLRRRAHCVLIH